MHKDPIKFLNEVVRYVNHVHVKDVSRALAEAARGKSTGISASVVLIGSRVNANNIAKCIQLLQACKWDGVFSIESDGEENVTQSVKRLRDKSQKARRFLRNGVSQITCRVARVALAVSSRAICDTRCNW